VEEQERVMSQVFEGDRYDVASARQPGMSMSYAPFGLKTPRPQPVVRQDEARTAMVVLSIGDPNRAPILEHRAILRHTVRNAGEQFCQVECRVRVMVHPEQEYLSVQIVHPTDRACGAVGWKGERVGGDTGGLGPDRREGEGVIASQHTGQSPERIRYDSKVC
jgi:hypothetical protein